MKSFGIYYSKNSLTDDAGQSELHINIWKLTKSKKKFYCVDFGILFDSRIDQILLLVPFAISKGQIVDLGYTIAKDSDLTSRLFNAETSSSRNTQSSFTIVTKDKSKSFEICNLDIDNKTIIEVLKSDQQMDYTLIQLDIPKKETPHHVDDSVKSNTIAQTKPDTNYYARFRLMIDDGSVLSKIENVANDIIQSAFSKLELFDIRVNDARHIPFNLAQIIANDKKQCPFYFSKVHFFYMVDVKESMQTTSPSCHDSRFMDYMDWKTYLKEDTIAEKSFISYHWKKERATEKENIKSFQLCYSCLFPDRNLMQLFAYMGLVVLLGFLGSMLCINLSIIASTIPVWFEWIKIGLVALIFVLELFYFVFYNRK